MPTPNSSITPLSARVAPATRAEIETQVAAVNALHANAVAACFAKCVPRPRDDQLGIGEMACIDRCTAKYLEATEVVRTELETARNKAAVDYP